MREVKFRGLTLKNENIPGSKSFWVTGEVHIKCKRPHIHTDMGVSECVIPETITEYTGLKDKNGKEVYEGDIVKYYDIDFNLWDIGDKIREVWGEIIFLDGQFTFKHNQGYLLMFLTRDYQTDEYQYEFENADNRNDFLLKCPTYKDLFLMEVVGNRFENPELLKNIEE